MVARKPPKKTISKHYFKDDAKHVRLYDWFQNSDAWKSLRPGPRAYYVELKRRYWGGNNGEIGFGAREAAKQLNINPDTATVYSKELQRKGFIKAAHRGSFDTSKGERLATEWILTEESYNQKVATKEFMRWKSSSDDFPVFDGASSFQKARRRQKRQSEKSEPGGTQKADHNFGVVPTIGTNGPKNWDEKRQHRQTSSPKNSDTSTYAIAEGEKP